MPPAILKGWIDRVLRMEVAYRFVANDQGEGVPVGLLKAKAAIVFNTAHAPEDREQRVFRRPAGNALEKMRLRSCGVKNVQRRTFSVVVTSTRNSGRTWLAEVGGIVLVQFPAEKMVPDKPGRVSTRNLAQLRVQGLIAGGFMSTAFKLSFVAASCRPLQTLEPVASPAGPALKNEMMLPAVLDPWAGHALFEAANLAKNLPGSKVWLVSLGPKAKLQQVMMTVAQKVPFELVALDGPASGFTDATETASALAEAIAAIPGLDKSRLLVFGGWESASRGAGATMQIVGERLGIVDQFQGVDQLTVNADGSLEILERIEGGKHQVSKCAGRRR